MSSGEHRIITGLAQSHQTPFLEFVDNRWHVWLNYNRDKTAGTYLSLLNNGSILRCTLQPTGEVTEVVTIAPPV